MKSTDQMAIECWCPTPHIERDIAELAQVLHSCVEAGAAVSFVQPFSLPDAAAFWRNTVLPAVESGSCRVLIARHSGRIVGTVQMHFATAPNQPHHADIRKLLVHPDTRRLGVARSLMLAVEEQALEDCRTLLTLDTRTGDVAEPMYLSLGYIKIGAIPGYAYDADRRHLHSATFMYKHLFPA
jgi:GNAT superfamily N-acetyltransferase